MEKRRVGGGHMTVLQYLKGGYKEDGESLFTRGFRESTRSNRYQLQEERFHISKYQRNQHNHLLDNLPRDTVKSPSLEVFKA